MLCKYRLLLFKYILIIHLLLRYSKGLVFVTSFHVNIVLDITHTYTAHLHLSTLIVAKGVISWNS